VRGMDISLADLAAMLKATKTGGATSGQVGPKSAAPAETETEDSEDED